MGGTTGGSGQSPMALLSPSVLTFSNQSVGTVSQSSPVTLTNPGNAALDITAIATTSTTKDFGQINNCTSSLAAGGKCTINVTFSPTSTGSLSGAITITDNAVGSP
jgi:hypothetical protein